MIPTLVLSVSGGKDSTALALHIRELELPFKALYFDVGWDAAPTYDYVRNVLPGIIGCDIDWRSAQVDVPPELMPLVEEAEAALGISPSAMVRLAILKGTFPARTLRWCTEQLKVMPAIRYFGELGGQVVNATGIRAEESAARALLRPWEMMEIPRKLQAPGLEVAQWRPLLHWTEDDVIAIHRRHNVKPNPLYFRSASRVGCWPCIFAKKDELRRISEDDPNRIAAMRVLERIVGERASARRNARLAKGEENTSRDGDWTPPNRRDSPRASRRSPSACTPPRTSAARTVPPAARRATAAAGRSTRRSSGARPHILPGPIPARGPHQRGRVDDPRRMCACLWPAASRCNTMRPGDMMENVACSFCGQLVPLDTKYRQARYRYFGRVYCDKGCGMAAIGRASRTFGQLASYNREHASERMRKNNPMADPETREKMRASLLRIGHHPAVRGGNGRGLTAPQERILAMLPPGWSAEVVVPCGRGCRAEGRPTAYKIDLADPVRKIGIEVDGGSHAGLRREADKRKDAWLATQGWRVVRMPNKVALAVTPDELMDLIR